jgi:hypothetical protein
MTLATRAQPSLHPRRYFEQMIYYSWSALRRALRAPRLGWTGYSHTIVLVVFLKWQTTQ